VPRRFVTRDGQPIHLDRWHPGEDLYRFLTDAPSIYLIMRDAGVAEPPEIPGWPPAEGDPGGAA
jgi:hypothetical protein